MEVEGLISFLQEYSIILTIVVGLLLLAIFLTIKVNRMYLEYAYTQEEILKILKAIQVEKDIISKEVDILKKSAPKTRDTSLDKYKKDKEEV